MSSGECVVRKSGRVVTRYRVRFFNVNSQGNAIQNHLPRNRDGTWGSKRVPVRYAQSFRWAGREEHTSARGVRWSPKHSLNRGRAMRPPVDATRRALERSLPSSASTWPSEVMTPISAGFWPACCSARNLRNHGEEHLPQFHSPRFDYFGF
jgi:hypothetical protein